MLLAKLLFFKLLSLVRWLLHSLQLVRIHCSSCIIDKSNQISSVLFNLIGFNVEMLHFKGVNFTIWDVGGRDAIVCNSIP